jgi:primosomal replication protein N
LNGLRKSLQTCRQPAQSFAQVCSAVLLAKISKLTQRLQIGVSAVVEGMLARTQQRNVPR